MRSLITAMFCLLLTTATLSAQVYDHQKSKVKMDVSGKQVEIKYLWGRPGTGAKLGTRLFEGGVNERSGKIEGDAYVYSEHCKRWYNFWVVGDFVNGSDLLILSGRSPIVSRSTCLVVDGKQSDLVFTIDREPY